MSTKQYQTWNVDFNHLSDQQKNQWSTYFTDPQQGDRFHNPWTDQPQIKTSRLLQWKLSKNPHRAVKKTSKPAEPLPFDFSRPPKQQTRVTWLGHASVLIDIEGYRIVIDPVIGDIASGLVKRASSTINTTWHDIDAVLLTHGHYDHFDIATLKALAKAPKPPLFITPKGLACYLPKICQRRIELNWWQGLSLDEVNIILVPAQHWHKRRLGDTNRALWGGYVVQAEKSIYHCGDTGFFEGFAAIPAVLANIDVACLPAGAYEPRWFMGPQHMAPEDSARAAALLGAHQVLAMHWGTFNLSDEGISAGPALLRHAMHQAPDSQLHVVSPGGSLTFEDNNWKVYGSWHG